MKQPCQKWQGCLVWARAKMREKCTEKSRHNMPGKRRKKKPDDIRRNYQERLAQGRARNAQRGQRGGTERHDAASQAAE